MEKFSEKLLIAVSSSVLTAAVMMFIFSNSATEWILLFVGVLFGAGMGFILTSASGSMSSNPNQSVHVEAPNITVNANPTAEANPEFSAGGMEDKPPIQLQNIVGGNQQIDPPSVANNEDWQKYLRDTHGLTDKDYLDAKAIEAEFTESTEDDEDEEPEGPLFSR